MKKRGVTLLETVVAMFLLTIITGAAFTLCSRMVVQTDRAETKFRAQSSCNDVIECFKVVSAPKAKITESEDKFLSALQFVAKNASRKDVTSDDSENATVVGYQYIVTYGADYTVYASVSFVLPDYIQIQAKTVDGSAILYQTEYRRATL